MLLFLLSGFKCDYSRLIYPSYMNPFHGLQAVWTQLLMSMFTGLSVKHDAQMPEVCIEVA